MKKTRAVSRDGIWSSDGLPLAATARAILIEIRQSPPENAGRVGAPTYGDVLANWPYLTTALLAVESQKARQTDEQF